MGFSILFVCRVRPTVSSPMYHRLKVGVDYDVALASANIVVNLAAPEGGFKFLLVQYVSPSLTPIVHYLNSTYTVLLQNRDRPPRNSLNSYAPTPPLLGRT
jgi:hypothetical protein